MDQAEIPEVIAYVAAEARRYLDSLPEDPVRLKNSDEAAYAMDRSFPEEGAGALATLRTLAEQGFDGAVRSGGPRFFHFVIGGVTPAALGADWLATTLDQNNAVWVISPIGAQLEVIAIDWLKQLFGLPSEFGGILTTGATMANYTALAAARRWWGRRNGVDVDVDGLSKLGSPPIFSSGYVHPSAVKAFGMLGMGRGNVIRFARDAVGRIDLGALDEALASSGPAIVVANAGEVNAGDFDPIDAMADLTEKHGAWLHVDGAFGLFAAVSDRTKHLVKGIERAQSVISDGHKWLNVPYDCGFAFIKDPSEMSAIFGMSAAYLEKIDDPKINLGYLGPESSRRARSFAVWATLAAYGRNGYRAMVERNLDHAQRAAGLVDEAFDLERLADVPLNIVCFRYRPDGVPEEQLDELNTKLAQAVLDDGRVYVGSTNYEGRVAFRPAFVNWQTSDEDVDLLIEVIRELGSTLTI